MTPIGLVLVWYLFGVFFTMAVLSFLALYTFNEDWKMPDVVVASFTWPITLVMSLVVIGKRLAKRWR